MPVSISTRLRVTKRLERLHNLTDADVEDYLTSLPGVGIKSRNTLVRHAKVWYTEARCVDVLSGRGLKRSPP